MTHIVDILNYEEGFRDKPYRDSEGYPTVGTGILIGPKNAALSNYTFTVPKQVADVWLQVFIDKKLTEMRASTVVAAALPLWKKYRVLLSRVDANTSDEISWPEKPE